MTEDKKDILDPETGEEKESSQFEGDESLEEVANNLEETEGEHDPDAKFITDTEERNPHSDEADAVSGPTAEGRRTRVDDLPENPSEEN